jgi:hypothetical protein
MYTEQYALIFLIAVFIGVVVLALLGIGTDD